MDLKVCLETGIASMAFVGHTLSTAGTFRRKFQKKFRKDPGNALRAFPGSFPSRVRLGSPKPYNSRHLKAPGRFQNSLPPSTAGDASFFRSGSGEGLSEPLSWNSQQYLETNLASRWKGVRPPPSFWEVPGLPQKFPELPRKFFGDFPGSSLTVELNSNPEVPRKFPGLPRKFPKLPRKFPDFPGGQPLSLGSLTPSPDSQKLSLKYWGYFRILK